MTKLSDDDKDAWEKEISGIKTTKKKKIHTFKAPQNIKVKRHTNHGDQQLFHEQDCLGQDNLDQNNFAQSDFAHSHFILPFPLINGELGLRKKILANKIRAQRNIDLHGSRINEVYNRLNIFFNSAIKQDLNYIIIVTGKSVLKAAENKETIKKTTIEFLCHSPFNNYIRMMFHPSNNNGGTGAIFVVLKSLK